MEGGLGSPALAVDAQLFLEAPELLQTDVVAAAHHHHHGPQLLRQLALRLQPADDVAVDGRQGRTAGRLHQHLLIV